jgi:hypothetical protein
MIKNWIYLVCILGILGLCVGMGAKHTIPNRSPQPEWDYTIDLMVPSPGWELAIHSIHEGKDDTGRPVIYILCQLMIDDSHIYPQVITPIRKTIRIMSTQHPVKPIIYGHNWNWHIPEVYNYYHLRSEIPTAILTQLSADTKRPFFESTQSLQSQHK